MAPISFSRAVLSFHNSAFSEGMVRQAAEFASLFKLTLHGLFIEDPMMAGATQWTGLREFNLLDRRWQAYAGSAVPADLQMSEARARKLIERAARGQRITSGFEVVRANVAAAVSGASAADDIILVCEPENPIERIAYGFRQMLDAAVRSPSAMLWLPRKIAGGGRPILLIDDGDSAVAEAIRGIIGEPLEIFRRADEEISHPISGAPLRYGGPPCLVVMTCPLKAALKREDMVEFLQTWKAPVLLLPGAASRAG
ncbi:hypothetical protein [Roseibium sp.]|uniref:hypothetical protein n=1 Tax=Roseibium sp. TaxID=1936156 RepID=UPI003A969CC5